MVGEGGGGYTAGMVLGLDLETSMDKQNPTTKCAVFISPTVDWKLSGFQNFTLYKIIQTFCSLFLYELKKLLLCYLEQDII